MDSVRNTSLEIFVVYLCRSAFYLLSLFCECGECSVSVVTERACGLGVRFAGGNIIYCVTTELLTLLHSELHVNRAVTLLPVRCPSCLPSHGVPPALQ